MQLVENRKFLPGGMRTLLAQCIAAWLMLAGLSLSPAHAQAFICEDDCKLQREGAYPHLIVGSVVSGADETQSAVLFGSMRQEGRWKALPDDAGAFVRTVHPVSVRLPSGRIYTVLISQEEAKLSPFKAGDLVRYAPHRNINEKPPTDPKALAYWNVTGCVAILCRAGDAACARGYRTGVYRATDGVALVADGGNVDPNAQGIDPHSMRPR